MKMNQERIAILLILTLLLWLAPMQVNANPYCNDQPYAETISDMFV